MTTATHTTTAWRAALLVAAVSMGLAGCVSEPFTGSEIILEFGIGSGATGIGNRPSEHYELFAEINDGLVSVGKFRIDSNLAAVDYPGGQKIGTANKLGPSLPERGITFRTPANLEDATGLLITLETNGETDLAPSEQIIGYGTVVYGPRATMVAEIEGEVPTLQGSTPLVESRAVILLMEDTTYLF